MRIITYNVNGVRSALRKNLAAYIEQSHADIFCLQESKAQPGQFDRELFRFMGYQDYWHSAERKGYSGVGIISKTPPREVVYGCGVPEFDAEGRVMRADWDELSVLSLYLPNGTSGEIRQQFKMDFCHFFRDYVQSLLQKQPQLVVCGDFNICHQPIDIHDPVRNAQNSGFLPEERDWVSSFLSMGMVDGFRAVHPDRVQYSWWSFRAQARKNNKGWRIDYHMVSAALAGRIENCFYDTNAHHSDHCPGVLDLDMPGGGSSLQ